MKNKKYLYCCGNGLNDMFSGLSYAINTLKSLNIPLNNLYFSHWGNKEAVYTDLNKFLIFNEVKYINMADVNEKEDYFLIPPQPSGYTNLNWGTPYHLRNFVSFKDEILKEAEKYFAPIGVHFRCGILEQKNINKISSKDIDEINEEYELYCKKFLKIYDPQKRYFCSSDSEHLTKYFKKYNNVKVINKKGCQSSSTARHTYTKEAILDLAVLSNCNLLYYARGKFTELAIALNQKINQTPFTPFSNNEERKYRILIN